MRRRPDQSISDVATPSKPVKPMLMTSLRVLLLIVPLLIIVATFSNPIAQSVKRFWTTSGDFWQSQWDHVLDYYGEDEKTYWVWGTLIITFIVYWFFGAFYMFLDITLKPEVLRKYKVQPGTNEPVDTKKLFKALAVVVFNQTVVSGALSYRGFVDLHAWRGFPPLRELPTFHCIVFSLIVCNLVEEVVFYYSHRLLHHRYLYKYIHKRHHEWTAPIAVAAQYAHPIEHVLSNILPPFMGVLLLGAHVTTAWIWYSWLLLTTLTDHSGYHMPFLISSEFHDFHHLKFTQCFGTYGLLDRLHNTDSEFVRSGMVKRHKMLWGLIPANKLYPIEKKANK